MTDARERNALKALHEIEAQIADTNWTIDERVFSSGEWNGQTATLELEYDPEVDLTIVEDDSVRHTVKTIVAQVADRYPSGARLNEVISRAVEELDIEPEAARDEIEQLRRQGDVYEPNTDRLRVV